MKIKAGDKVRIIKRNKELSEWTIVKILKGKDFVLVTNGNYTTTLDMSELKQLQQKGKIKLQFLRENSEGGFEVMKSKIEQNKDEFLAFFNENGIKDESKRQALRKFEVSMVTLNKYLQRYGLVAAEKDTYPELTEEILLEECKTFGYGQAGISKFADKYGKRICQVETLIKRYDIRNKLKNLTPEVAETVKAADSQDAVKKEAGEPVREEAPAPTNNDVQPDVQEAPADNSKANRLTIAYLRGGLADYDLSDGVVRIVEKNNENYWITISASKVAELIMELDELLSHLESQAS